MKLYLLSLGCAKNSVDSENLLGLLRSGGAEIVSTPEEADTVVVNTCGFIQAAVEESVDAILDLELMKEQGRIEKIVVVGCLVNRCEGELKRELPSVDLWARAEEWDLVAAGLGLKGGGAARGILPETRRWSRYLKVGEGCDTFCSYCTIPSIRGRARSMAMEDLAAQAAELADQGAREICLVGQDLTIYGRDRYGTPRLTELLERLDDALPEGVWLRLLYLHPTRVDERFIDFVAGSRRVLPYLDIPIQHIDGALLGSMNRPDDEGHIRRIFSYARSVDPGFALRTTVMAGYPGETEDQFRKLLDFLGEAEIDRVGAFVYSKEKGTPAARMGGQIPKRVKERRYARIMERQAEISLERQRFFLGKTMTVLVDEAVQGEEFAWGRSYRDAPEVDGLVGIPMGDGIEQGEFVEVRVTDVTEHDLFAEIDG